MHLYVVQQWKRILVLLYVETMGMFATFNSILGLMLKCLINFGGLGLKDLFGELVNIGYNDSNMFQGHRIGVIQQFKEKVAPFVMGLSASYKSYTPFLHIVQRNLLNFKI